MCVQTARLTIGVETPPSFDLRLPFLFAFVGVVGEKDKTTGEGVNVWFVREVLVTCRFFLSVSQSGWSFDVILAIRTKLLKRISR